MLTSHATSSTLRELAIMTFQVRTAPFRSSGLKTIGWDPDFQHVYLPELSSEGTRAYRDYAYRQLADQCAP